MYRIVVFIYFIILVFSDGANYDAQPTWAGSCIVGTSQSPININTNLSRIKSSIVFNIAFNDTEVDVSPVAPVLQSSFTQSVITLGGSLNLVFTALQYHFHTRSQHSFDGRVADLQLHIVHTLNKEYSYPRNYSVVGILFRAVPDSSTQVTIFDQYDFTIPTKVNLAKAIQPLITNQNIYTYQGSLTTPTCNEFVNWFVVQQIYTIKQSQLKQYIRAINHGSINNRKTQPISARKVKLIVRNPNTVCQPITKRC